MKRLFLVVIAVVLVVGLIFTGCAESAPSGEEPYEITLMSLSAGSSCYIGCTILADEINKRSTWLKASAPEGVDPMITLKTLVEKPELRKNTFIWNNSAVVWLANHHEGPTGDPPFNTFDYNEFKLCFIHGIAGSVLVTLDPEIKTLEDLNGKTVCIGSTASDWKFPLWEEAIKLAGVTPRKYEHIKQAPAMDALRDGLIDVWATGSAPTPDGPWKGSSGLPDLIASADVYFIVPDRAKLEAACQAINFPNPTLTVPAGDLDPRQTEDLPVLSAAMWYGAHESFPDEVVTEIMGVVWETCETWKEHLGALGAITRKSLGAAGHPESDYHPAALKFLKEKGVAITSWGNW